MKYIYIALFGVLISNATIVNANCDGKSMSISNYTSGIPFYYKFIPAAGKSASYAQDLTNTEGTLSPNSDKQMGKLGGPQGKTSHLDYSIEVWSSSKSKKLCTYQGYFYVSDVGQWCYNKKTAKCKYAVSAECNFDLEVKSAGLSNIVIYGNVSKGCSD